MEYCSSWLQVKNNMRKASIKIKLSVRRIYKIHHHVQKEMMVRVEGMCDGGLLVEVEVEGEGGTRLLGERKKMFFNSKSQ